MKKLTKLFAGFAFVAALAFSGAAFASGFGFKVGGADVGDVSTTACTTAINQTVDSFGNGVSMDQVWALQREVGSPGSGVFETVSGHADIFPTVNGGTTVGGVTQVDRYNSPTKACFRLFMTTDTAGTAQVQIVTDRRAPTAFPGVASHIRRFDDMLFALLPVDVTHDGHVASYLTFKGGGTNAVNAVVEEAQEGLITLSTGSSDDDTDMSVFSYGQLAHGSLVSSGLTVVEYRATVETITIAAINFGLGDIIQTAGEEMMMGCNTNVCVETNDDMNNLVSILFDTDSNDAQGDFFLAGSENADAVGNAADEYSLGSAPVASTFFIVRIEVDATGDAFFYINSVLQGAEPLAVATTAVLIPTVTANSPADGTAAVRKYYIDYIDFWVPRTPG